MKLSFEEKMKLRYLVAFLVGLPSAFGMQQQWGWGQGGGGYPQQNNSQAYQNIPQQSPIPPSQYGDAIFQPQYGVPPQQRYVYNAPQQQFGNNSQYGLNQGYNSSPYQQGYDSSNLSLQPNCLNPFITIPTKIEGNKKENTNEILVISQQTPRIITLGTPTGTSIQSLGDLNILSSQQNSLILFEGTLNLQGNNVLCNGFVNPKVSKGNIVCNNGLTFLNIPFKNNSTISQSIVGGGIVNSGGGGGTVGQPGCRKVLANGKCAK